jgi:L-alanine-DL-glutamate epimerase-like enolase superfamily enzyme
MAGCSSFLILEYGWGEIPWRGELTEPAEEIHKGHLVLSDRPGLGLELNPDAVEAHRVELDGWDR